MVPLCLQKCRYLSPKLDKGERTKIGAKSLAQQKDLQIRLEIRLEINFYFIPLSSFRLCLISINLRNIHLNPLDIPLYIDGMHLDFWIYLYLLDFSANKINPTKFDLVGLNL